MRYDDFKCADFDRVNSWLLQGNARELINIQHMMQEMKIRKSRKNGPLFFMIIYITCLAEADLKVSIWAKEGMM